MLWEILKAGRTNNSEDLFTRLAAEGISGAMNTSTVSGISPLVMPNCSGKPLTAWSITGNTVQNGTPTPDTPQEVKAVGDRTENLFDKTQPTTTTNKYLLSNGEESSSSSGWAVSAYIPVNGEYVTISGVGGNSPSICAYDSNMQFVRGKNYAGTNITTINISECSYIRFSYVPSVQGNTAMLNYGSTALPYEPYGYKIPVVTSADGTEPITTPIYLPTPLYSGDVLRSDGSRDVKWDRLVLTGDEEITTHKVFEDGTVSIRIPSSKAKADGIIYCTHLQNVSFTEIYNNEKQGISAHLKNEFNNLYSLISGFTKVTQYKDFFRNEYSAGTPVTVWYQLADPTTETVTVPRIQTIRSSAATLSIDTQVQPENVTVKYRR